MGCRSLTHATCEPHLGHADPQAAGGRRVAPLGSAAWSEVMPTVAPSLVGPGMAALLGASVAYAVAYWVPDRVNVVK